MSQIDDGTNDVDSLGLDTPTFYAPSPDTPYQPPPRKVVIDGRLQDYRGPGLVNADNQFDFYDQSGLPGNYNLRNDPLQLYLSLPQEELDGLLGLMENVGYKVNTRAQQLSAIGELMEASNVIGRTYGVTLRELGMRAPAMATAAPRYRVSAPGDILTVGNEVAKKTLGRQFTEDEGQRFVSSYQQAELQYQQAGSGVVTSAPSADVAAEQFATQAAPDEAQAYKYLGAVDMLMRNVGEI
jgi:hypothetical protein